MINNVYALLICSFFYVMNITATDDSTVSCATSTAAAIFVSLVNQYIGEHDENSEHVFYCRQKKSFILAHDKILPALKRQATPSFFIQTHKNKIVLESVEEIHPRASCFARSLAFSHQRPMLTAIYDIGTPDDLIKLEDGSTIVEKPTATQALYVGSNPGRDLSNPHKETKEARIKATRVLFGTQCVPIDLTSDTGDAMSFQELRYCFTSQHEKLTLFEGSFQKIPNSAVHQQVAMFFNTYFKKSS